MRILGSSFFQSFITQGRKEFLNYSTLQGKAINKLECLKECPIVGTKSWIYFETLLGSALWAKDSHTMPVMDSPTPNSW